MYEICRKDVDYLRELEQKHYEQTVFTTYPWVKFIEKNRKAEPVILQIIEKGKLVAVFVGLVITKFGIRILGSPFEEWMTEDMGFIKIQEFDVGGCIHAVSEYAFKKLKCWYVQIRDKKIKKEDIPKDIHFVLTKSLQLDLQRSEEEIFSSFRKEARRHIRRSEKKGAVLREVPFDDDFARKYYEQLEDVFAKQNLKPNYDLKKILDIVDSMRKDPDKVLAMQVISPENVCIASSMYFLYGEWCYSLGTASFKEYQHYLPNEMIRWHGICYCKSHGSMFFDFCGYREYKMKFSPETIEVPTIEVYKYKCLVTLKQLAKKTIVLYRKIRGKLLVHNTKEQGNKELRDTIGEQNPADGNQNIQKRNEIG